MSVTSAELRNGWPTLAIAAVVGVAGAMFFAPDREASYGFASDSDRQTRKIEPNLLTPLPTLWSRASECDGGEGSDASTPPSPATPPQTWVVTQDYPLSALRTNRQGRTAFRLAIDSGGGVTNCHVTQASGTVALDEAACFALARRARFTPARDGRGCPIPSSYSSSVVWQIPSR